MAANNLVLQLLITARDEASAAFGKVFSALNDSTNVLASKIRAAFTGLFNITDEAQAFEAQLARVKSKAGATTEDMERLKKAALDMGRQMGVSAVDAAQGLEILTGAGLTVDQAISALGPTLRVMATEQVSADAAAKALTDTLALMGVSLDQAARAGDVLQAGADATSTGVLEMAEAFRNGGAAATLAGLSLEQTATILTAFAKYGLKGSEAGTALTGMLNQLNDPASKARIELGKLGQTTGDVSEMIAVLTKAGPRGSAAMLAFGDAQTGVNAVLKTGVQGFADYAAAIDKAGGGLAAASGTIGHTTAGALATLNAAWQQVKLALTGTLLQPLADSARAAAEALNTALTSGALKPVEEAIRAFATRSAQAVMDFAGSFNFSAAITALQAFAKGAQESFESARNAGKAAADVVTVAWNAVTAGFRTIAAALLETAGSAMATLANMEEAASKVGLGSLQRAKELRETALNLQGAALEIVQQIEQDGRELGAAFSRLSGTTDAATAAQERLKNALPTAEIQQINYSLQDYQTLAGRANAATQQARADYEAGKISAEDYGKKLLDSADAAYHLEAATVAQAEGTKEAAASAAESALKLTEMNRQIKVGTDNAGAWRSGMELNGVVMLGLRDAAQAAADKLAYLQSIQATLPDADRQIATAKQAAINAQNLYNKALDENITQQERRVATIERSNNLEQKSYDLRIQQAQVEADLARIKGDALAETRAENDVIDLSIEKIGAAVSKKQDEIAAYADLIEATRLKLAADGELDASDQDRLVTMADTLAAMKQDREELAQTAQAARDLADAKKKQKEAEDAAKKAAKDAADAARDQAEQLQAQGAGVSGLLSGWIERLNALSPAARAAFDGVQQGAEVARLNLDQLNEQLDATNREAGLIAEQGGAGFIRWANQAALKALSIEQAFLAQKIALEQAVTALDRYADTGQGAVQAQQALIQTTGDAARNFDLLNEADLSRLQDSIDRAREAMDALRQSSEAALDAAQRALLQEQGDQAGLLALERKQKELALQEQINEAKAAGDAEALRNLQQALDLEQQAFDLKAKKLQADGPARPATPGSAAFNAAPAKIVQLDLTVAGHKLKTMTADDPNDFLDALEQAKNRSLR